MAAGDRREPPTSDGYTPGRAWESMACCPGQQDITSSAMEGHNMFTRIAVVNRGEAAVRLIRAVRELNEEHGYGIKVIALHTEAEQRTLFVRSADEAVCLRDVESPTGSYLDHEELERALRVSRADAGWVGWGFVAEDPAFVDLCERLGMVFIGPPASAIRQLCDRIEARLLAEKTGIPVAPWSGGPVSSRQEAGRHGDTIGYPLL